MAIVPGTRVGPYEITGLIGQGGMGLVYRAIDTNLKRTVAIKVLPESVASDSDRLARFQREAEVLARLNHPHIAQIFGLERSDGATALVMEFVEGPTLADRIAQGPVPVDDALAIAREIAAALEAAHEQGIIHRDLKPANIKVRPDGVVKVLDFGLAKALEPAGAIAAGVAQSPTITSPAITGVGVLLGTAAYMSPEQARGKTLDKRTDVWAFGAVLYEMLTGQRAFAGDDVSDVLASVLAREPDWTRLPAGLSPAIIVFVKRCLQRDPKQRVRDIGDIALALNGAFDVGSAAAVNVERPPSMWRRLIPIAVTALVAVLLTGLTAWRLWPSDAPRSTTRFDYILPEGQRLQPTQRPVITVSADGHFFIYQTTGGLYLRSIGSLDARIVPITDENLVSPFLSPDGRWIGYFTGGVAATSGQLRKVPVNGGPAATLCDASYPFGASWAADNTIVFGQAAGIMRVSANGGTPALVVAATDGEQLFGPQLLPGGAGILFSVTKDLGPARWDRAQVVVQSLSSNQRTVVVQGGSDARYLPSGHLVYTVRDGLLGAGFDLQRLTLRGGAVPLVQGVQQPVGVAAAASNYAVSDEGTLIYLSRDAFLRSLVWVHRNGTAEMISTIPAGAYEDLRLSPDAHRVLATRDGDIWIYELASGRSSRLTRDGSSLMGVWDPTGTRIAYSSAHGGNLEAWVAPADGSAQPQQLTHLGGQVHVDSWSPDGSRIAFHHHRGERPVPILMQRIDQPDAKPEAFVEGAFNAEGADFARDGRHVVYLSQETGQREIYIRPYPGPGGQVPVSVGGGTEPVWAGNGDVFYRSLNGERMYVAAVSSRPNLDVGTPVQLFQGRHYIAPTGSPRPQYDVTADGQRLLMLAIGGADSGGVRPRIVVVQNWFDELKRLIPSN